MKSDRWSFVGIMVSDDGRWEQNGKRLPWIAIASPKNFGVKSKALMIGPLCFLVSEKMTGATQKSWKAYLREKGKNNG